MPENASFFTDFAVTDIDIGIHITCFGIRFFRYGKRRKILGALYFTGNTDRPRIRSTPRSKRRLFIIRFRILFDVLFRQRTRYIRKRYAFKIFPFKNYLSPVDFSRIPQIIQASFFIVFKYNVDSAVPVNIHKRAYRRRSAFLIDFRIRRPCTQPYRSRPAVYIPPRTR